MSGLWSSLDASYFRLAFVEALIVGVLGGVVGVQVMLRRLPMFVLALSHSTFPGVVIAAIIGVDVVFGALVAAVLTAMVVVGIGATRAIDSASATGVLLAGAFALGIVLLNAAGVSSRELVGYLVGSILTVSTGDVIQAAVIAVVCIGVIVTARKEIVLSTFDPSAARALGYRTGVIDFVMLLMIAVSVVVMIPAVGTLLSLGLMTVPAMTARLWCTGIGRLMIVSASVGALASVGGLLLSTVVDVAVSGLISVCLGGLFLLSFAATYRRQGRVSRDTVPSLRPTMTSDV